MTAAVQATLEGLKNRVEEYRSRLASLGLAMNALQQCADDLLAAMEQDCLGLHAACAAGSETQTEGPAAIAAATAAAAMAPLDCTATTVPVGGISCPAEPTHEPAQADDHPAEGEAAPATPARAAAPDQPDDFTLIKGIDAETADALVGLGLTRFSELAGLYPEDVDEIGVMLADRRRISREGWIEQAAILAAGDTTAYVRQLNAAQTETAPASPFPEPMPAAASRDWAPCFAPLQVGELPANGPDFVPAPARNPATIEQQIAEARAAARVGSRRLSIAASRRSGARQRAKQQTLTQHRSAPRTGLKMAMTMATAVALAFISGSIVASDGLQRELAARLARLSTCTVDTISANHDCAVLAWLSL